MAYLLGNEVKETNRKFDLYNLIYTSSSIAWLHRQKRYKMVHNKPGSEMTQVTQMSQFC